MALFPVRGIDHFSIDGQSESAEAAFMGLLAAIMRSSNSSMRDLANGEQLTEASALQYFRHECLRARPQGWGLRIVLNDPLHPRHIWYFGVRGGPFPTINALMTTESDRSAGVIAAKSAVCEDADRAYWQSGWGYFGPADTVFIAMKRRALAALCGDLSWSSDQIAAAYELRMICRRLGRKLFDRRPNIRVSTWFGADSSFAARIDAELTTYVGKSQLQKLLERAGMSYDTWMAATSNGVSNSGAGCR